MMITRAIVIVPPRTESLVHRQDMDPLGYVGGLPIVTRITYTAQWAGISEGLVLSWGGWPEIGKRLGSDPKNTAFQWAEHPLRETDEAAKERLSQMVKSRFLLISSQWILDRSALKELCERASHGEEGGMDFQDPYPESILPPAVVIDGTRDTEIARLLVSGGEISELALLSRDALSRSRRVVRLGPPTLIKVHTKGDRHEAERHLFEGLVKPTESFMSRHIERKISLALSRRLIYTSITPNQISVFSILIGLLSSLFFVAESRALHVTGAVLLLLSSILDGCDGEIARLRFEESKRGSWIDFLGDNLVHMVVFFCIGWGLYARGSGVAYLVLGILGAVGTLASASMVFFRVFLKTKGRVISFATPVRIEEMERAGDDLRKRIEFTDKISNRDFIWIILAASLTGYLWLWAWLCGVGVLFYFFALLTLYLKMRSVPSPSRGACA